MDTATETQAQNSSDAKPPYGGYGTCRSFIDQMHDLHKAGHFPQVLDRSVMGQRGGSARSELYMALRFFGLIDDDKRPTERFRVLAANPPAEGIRDLVTDAYADIIALDLNTATPRQVDAAITEMGAPPSTVARARTFFLNAAEEAGLPVGQLLRTAPRGTQSPRKKRAKPSVPAEDTTPPAKITKQPPLIAALMDKLPSEEDGWSEDEARQWLSLVAPAIAYDYKLDLSKLTKAAA